jgi:hypothetical protein
MGRKKHPERAPQAAEHDQTLLQAVRGALAGLSEAGREATPPAIEEWIKANQYDVWASIATASALKGAIEAAARKEGAARPLAGAAKEASAPLPPPPVRRDLPVAPTKEASGMAGKKKTEQRQPAPERPHPAEPAGNGADRRARTRQEGGDRKPPPEAEQGGRKRKQPALTANAVREHPEAEGERRPSSPSGPKPRPAAAPAYDPTRSEMLRVLEVARQGGGVSKLNKMVQTIKLLADQVGGFDRLAVCLDALEEFGIK